MTEDELDLVETKDLIEALRRRYTGVLVLTLAAEKNDPEHELKSIFYHGGLSACLGLMEYAKHRMLSDPEEDEE